MFKNFFRKRKKKDKLDLAQISITFESLKKLETSGLLGFDVKNRRLFIEEPLAVVMLNMGADGWKNFIQNVFFWLYWRQCQENWDSFILKEELKAVHRAQRKYSVLTHRDMMRIRQARRESIAEDAVQPPKVEPFEFYVVRLKSEDDNDKEKQAVPSGDILAVGSYDYEADALEMADWETVKKFIDEKG